MSKPKKVSKPSKNESLCQSKVDERKTTTKSNFKIQSQTEKVFKDGMLHDNVISILKQFHTLVINWGYSADTVNENSLEYEVELWVKSAMTYGYRPNGNIDKWHVIDRKLIYDVFSEIQRLFRVILRPKNFSLVINGTWNRNRQEDSVIQGCIIGALCSKADDGSLFLDKKRLQLIREVYETHTFYKYLYLKQTPNSTIKDAIDLYQILEDLFDEFVSLLEKDWANDKNAA